VKTDGNEALGASQRTGPLNHQSGRNWDLEAQGRFVAFLVVFGKSVLGRGKVFVTPE